jgi:hypothetical protein
MNFHTVVRQRHIVSNRLTRAMNLVSSHYLTGGYAPRVHSTEGSGIRFYDPSAGESVPYRFTDSRGVDVWTKGKVTLLKDVTPVHFTTGTLRANGRPSQYARSIRYGTTRCCT